MSLGCSGVGPASSLGVARAYAKPKLRVMLNPIVRTSRNPVQPASIREWPTALLAGSASAPGDLERCILWRQRLQLAEVVHAPNNRGTERAGLA